MGYLLWTNELSLQLNSGTNIAASKSLGFGFLLRLSALGFRRFRIWAAGLRIQRGGSLLTALFVADRSRRLLSFVRLKAAFSAAFLVIPERFERSTHSLEGCWERNHLLDLQYYINTLIFVASSKTCWPRVYDCFISRMAACFEICLYYPQIYPLPDFNCSDGQLIVLRITCACRRFILIFPKSPPT